MNVPETPKNFREILAQQLQENECLGLFKPDYEYSYEVPPGEHLCHCTIKYLVDCEYPANCYPYNHDNAWKRHGG